MYSQIRYNGCEILDLRCNIFVCDYFFQCQYPGTIYSLTVTDHCSYSDTLHYKIGSGSKGTACRTSSAAGVDKLAGCRSLLAVAVGGPVYCLDTALVPISLFTDACN